MKFLIYGHQGWIGQQVVALMNKCSYNIVLGNARLDDDKVVAKEIGDISPTHIILLTGRTHGKIDDKEYSTIDYLEQKGKLVDNIRDNLYAPVKMAVLCQQFGIHLTYLGTGCIFEYDDEHPFGDEQSGFTENNLPNFFGSSYSIVKGFTDRLMHSYSNVLNLRIRMPITDEVNKRNFITKIVGYNKICSIPNSMTVLPELLPYAIDLVVKSYCGTINLVNKGLITHNEVLTMYKEIVDPTFTWVNFTLEEQAKVLASGRSNNCMDTTLLESLYPVKHIKDSIKDCLKVMAKKYVV